jgi:hypothetical protein
MVAVLGVVLPRRSGQRGRLVARHMIPDHLTYGKDIFNLQKHNQEGKWIQRANDTGGKPGIGVRDFTNSGETCEDPGPNDEVRAERGDRKGGGVARAGGHLVAQSLLSALLDSWIFL